MSIMCEKLGYMMIIRIVLKSINQDIFIVTTHDTLLDTFSFPLSYCLFGLGTDTVRVLVCTKIENVS